MRPTGEEATRQVLRRMLSGAGGGLSDQVQPIVKPAMQSRVEIASNAAPTEAVFDFSGGPLIVSTSNVYPARGGEDFITLDATLVQSLTATADIEVLVNGTAADTVTLPTGVTFDSQTVSLGTLAAGDLVQARIAAPGSGGVGLVVVLRQA